ncbi:pentatricopeptide repeat-containing protein At2g27610-like [Rosa rugosa]|uniref:pentatricopeptide repeat-containing protein At2g27610-like n=1 Tax=Rosa rugosa TaxID=74645 RepID=UPI002B4148A3|nr:pentatricopeptide repeat-containing protein At2g27610-like [Rosa rugosa]
MSLTVKLCCPQPALLLPTSASINKPIRNLTINPSSPTTQKLKGSNFLSSAPVAETQQKSEIKPLIDILRGCEDIGSLKQVKSVHGFASKSNLSGQDLLVLLNHVVHAYSKCSDFGTARKVFDEMSERNIFSWTVMIVGCTENGLFFDGFELFREMVNNGVLADKFVYTAIIQTCIGLDCVELGKMVHAQIVVRGFEYDGFVSTSLLNMYAKFGEIEDSCRMFNTMTEHTQVSWNAMISGLTSNGFHMEAFDQFLSMKRKGIRPNKYTLVSVSKAVGQLGDGNKCKIIHSCASELGVESSVLVGTALIDMYSKCKSSSDARSVFDTNFISCEVNMPWNAMICGYSLCGYSEQALELFVRMCRNNVQPDLYTYCSVFNAIAALKFLHLGQEIHAMVLKSGAEMKGTSVSNAIADAYAKCGLLEDVQKVFDKTEERDMVSWTTLVTAYSQCSEWEDALTIFSKMRDEGFTPNQFTLSSVLVACASLCSLEYGQQVHGLLCKAGLDTGRCTESALVDMYAKCGNITEAQEVFERITDPDTISWTAIISAYAQHGLVEDALELYGRMEQSGVKVNDVTLLCVLFACSHRGMVEEGLHHFSLMEQSCDLVPKMEHYACIVDLLGRVGRLNDAMDFIKRMPIEPNEMVWQALLAACRVHENVELGEIAAEKILSIRPEHSATYVLLSNTYIRTGSYEDGLSLRDAMKDRGVKKEPGCSWISVKGRVHKFYAGDQQHSEKHDIYAILEELRVKIKSLGYIPDLNYVLQDPHLALNTGMPE